MFAKLIPNLIIDRNTYYDYAIKFVQITSLNNFGLITDIKQCLIIMSYPNNIINKRFNHAY